MDSEPCRVIRQRTASQGSVHEAGSRSLHTAGGRLLLGTLEFDEQDWHLLQRCEVLELQSQASDEVSEGLSGIVGPPEATPPPPPIMTSVTEEVG